MQLLVSHPCSHQDHQNISLHLLTVSAVFSDGKARLLESCMELVAGRATTPLQKQVFPIEGHASKMFVKAIPVVNEEGDASKQHNMKRPNMPAA